MQVYHVALNTDSLMMVVQPGAQLPEQYQHLQRRMVWVKISLKHAEYLVNLAVIQQHGMQLQFGMVFHNLEHQQLQPRILLLHLFV